MVLFISLYTYVLSTYTVNIKSLTHFCKELSTFSHLKVKVKDTQMRMRIDISLNIGL